MNADTYKNDGVDEKMLIKFSPRIQELFKPRHYSHLRLQRAVSNLSPLV